MNTSVPETKFLTVDVFAQSGAVPVSCKISKGQLLPALSALNCGTAPADVQIAGYSAGSGTYLLYASGMCYYSDNGAAFYTPLTLTAETPVFLEERRDGSVWATMLGDTFCFLYSGMQYTMKKYGGIRLSGGVMHCGRFFGVDGSDRLLLRWSGEGGALDWNESISGAGWAYLNPERGKILQIVPNGEKLVAVREYGISEITAYGTPENFKISVGESAWGKVLDKSAAAVGNKVMFMTEAGMCAFSSSGIVRIDHSLAEDVSLPNCSAALNGAYLLGVQSSALGRGAILVYDPSDGTDYLIDVAPEALCMGAKPYVYGGGSVYVLTGGGEYAYTSGKLNFGTPYKKVLSSVTIDCDKPCDLEVTNGDLTRRLTGVGGKVRLNMNGRSFRITLKGTEKVRSLSASAEVIDGI